MGNSSLNGVYLYKKKNSTK